MNVNESKSRIDLLLKNECTVAIQSRVSHEYLLFTRTCVSPSDAHFILFPILANKDLIDSSVLHWRARLLRTVIAMIVATTRCSALTLIASLRTSSTSSLSHLEAWRRHWEDDGAQPNRDA